METGRYCASFPVQLGTTGNGAGGTNLSHALSPWSRSRASPVREERRRYVRLDIRKSRQIKGH